MNKAKIDNCSSWYSYIVIVLIALSIRMFVMEIFFVPSGSMKQTLLEGDYILSTKYSYGYSKHSLIFSPNLFSGRIFGQDAEYGDIIIFKPPHNTNIRYVKRLIAKPGDIVEIKQNIIYINGNSIRRNYIKDIPDPNDDTIKYKQYEESLPNGVSYYSYKVESSVDYNNIYQNDFGPYQVPQDSYFVLGDNRDQSKDSRFIGAIPFENLVAKARFVIFSTATTLWSKNISIKNFCNKFQNWISSIRWNRLFNSLYIESK